MTPIQSLPSELREEKKTEIIKFSIHCDSFKFDSILEVPKINDIPDLLEKIAKIQQGLKDGREEKV